MTRTVVKAIGGASLQLALISICLPFGFADDPPVELGKVTWSRDLSTAKTASSTSGKPILVLFQEVPGCQTCQDFGNQPLSHPLMVEAIEDLFVPVLIYNNKPEDEATLKAFSEPSWNNPVIRYLDATGKDLIERKDRVWMIRPTAQRMVASLRQAQRDVPGYLGLLANERSESENADSLTRATFAMHCYWEGEAKLGALPGVHSTLSAWVGDKEVVDVLFDKGEVEYEKLLEAAKSMECASTVYAHDDHQLALAKKLVGENAVAAAKSFESRRAKESDQKYYLRNSVYRHLPLTPLQTVKINAALMPPAKPKTVEQFLSPRQLTLLGKIKQQLQSEADSLNGFVYPDDVNQLAAYDKRIREFLAD